MPGLPLPSRAINHFVKTVTFTGATGLGLADEAIAIASVTGRVFILQLGAYCTTTLVGGAASGLSLGTAGDVDAIIAGTTPTALLANEIWNDATPGPQTHSDNTITDLIVGSNLQMYNATTNVTAGVIEFSVLWLPASINGNLG